MHIVSIEVEEELVCTLSDVGDDFECPPQTTPRFYILRCLSYLDSGCTQGLHI